MIDINYPIIAPNAFATHDEQHLINVSWIWFERKFKKDKYYPTAVTVMLRDLASTFNAWVEGISIDPQGWGAIICASRRPHEEISTEYIKDYTTYIHFDRFEDGLVLTLKSFYDHYGEDGFKVER